MAGAATLLVETVVACVPDVVSVPTALSDFMYAWTASWAAVVMTCLPAAERLLREASAFALSSAVKLSLIAETLSSEFDTDFDRSEMVSVFVLMSAAKPLMFWFVA